MCGIFGIIGPKYQNDGEIALNALHSRGPDASGSIKKSDVFLGHKRLSILDLSGGIQPMTSRDHRYVLTFNGEIYNYLEIKEELEDEGFVFSTHSDTEVLLYGLIRWKEKLLPKLDGMFAFGFWDSLSKELILGRDRTGIKPLFYSLLSNTCVFSSTINPFFKLSQFPLNLNWEALRDFLAFQTVYFPYYIKRCFLPSSCYLFKV
jgi:asparagine synthase (glutamine-hydrolysing)